MMKTRTCPHLDHRAHRVVRAGAARRQCVNSRSAIQVGVAAR